VSPLEVVRACLARIEAIDDQISAVVTLCRDDALAGAKQSEARWKAGTQLPLDGIPFGLKDLIYTDGIRTTGGSLMYQNLVPRTSATVADRLTDAGGVLLAKVHTWEFAADGVPLGYTRNPWSLSHMAGGSSSGSAAAVCAREMPLAIGTDTGGSIRVPTSFCGITSMKPTLGRVPRYGVMPLSWTLDHVGPMARSAGDVALALEVIAGHDPRDPSSATAPVDHYSADLDGGVAGLRLGVPSNWFFDICDPQVKAAADAAIKVLESAGMVVSEVRVPILDQVNPVTLLWLITNPEAASLHEVNTDDIALYSHDNARHIVSGRAELAVDYLRALRLRAVIQRDFETVFDTVDCLITPGTPSVAPLIETDQSIVPGWSLIGEDRYPWLEVCGRTTCVFNLAGMPALTFPSGFNADGLPMGIQLAAGPYQEATILRIAHAYQAMTDHHLAKPPIATRAVEA
jgi:aspartyl-tRNA(Asn)/glutamyl-tRNA(Gln) amidotransferase subunit A